MSEFLNAEQIVASLEDKRKALVTKATELADERQRVSYAAHTNDPKARQKLDKINAETAAFSSEMESLEAAIVEATARLNAAKAAEVMAADREKAKAIEALNAQLREQLSDAEAAFDDAISSVLTSKELLSQLHGLGVASPSDSMFRINSIIAIKTVIQNLPQNWINDFEFARLAPSQKRQFKSLADAWCGQITNQLPKKEEAA
jgi:predicted  nucleic acid-binding Zn-ribbon protein